MRHSAAVSLRPCAFTRDHVDWAVCTTPELLMQDGRGIEVGDIGWEQALRTLTAMLILPPVHCPLLLGCLHEWLDSLHRRRR